MVAKRIQLNEETWEAFEAVMHDTCRSFQDMADEAFADLLKKHKQPVGLMASLKESVRTRSRPSLSWPRYQGPVLCQWL
jgi:hypothetical protein